MAVTGWLVVETGAWVPAFAGMTDGFAGMTEGWGDGYLYKKVGQFRGNDRFVAHGDEGLGLRFRGDDGGVGMRGIWR